MGTEAVDAASAAATDQPTDAGTDSPTPSEAGAELTDEEILDSGEDAGEDPSDSPPPGARPEEKPAGQEGDQTKPPEQQKTQDEDKEVPSAGAIEPEELKAVFKSHPTLRDAYFREQAYREVFPTVAEARQIKEYFPEGLKSVQETATEIERMESFDNLLASGDPNDAAQLIRQISRDNPEGFRGILQAYPHVWAEADPQGYGQFSQALVNHFLDHLWNQAQASQDENLQAAIDVLSRRAYNRPYGAPANRQQADPREQQLAQRERALYEREEQARSAAEEGFYEDANVATVNQVVDAIKEQVGTLLPQGISDGAKNRIVGEVYRDVDGMLKGNRQLRAQLQRALKNGDQGSEHLKSVIGLVVSRAKQAIPGATAKAVNDWTSTVLANNRQQQERERAPARPDVGAGGAPLPRGKATPKPNQIDYARTSDDDILEDNYTLRK